MHRLLQPDGWATPRGYANGMAARGTLIFVGGQIGWNAASEFETDDLVGQLRQALLNVRAVLAVAGAGPEHLTQLTWYFTDRRDYLARLKPIGAIWREVMGRHYPTMAAIEVAGLMEPRAKVEIQAIAVLPDPRDAAPV